MQIDGIHALVTGGGSGLGAATARHLAGRGAHVTVIDRNAEAAHKVAEEIGGRGVGADVTDADLGPVFDAAGPIRVLVNCAGVGVAERVVGREGVMPLDHFTRVVSVNLVGTFNCLRLAAERMMALEPLETGERGVVVNTASVAAMDGQIGQAAYAASKGGVAAMTLPIAREFARAGIRVMTIAPGLFRTPLLEALPEEAQVSIAASIPFPARLGDPDEFAATVRHIVETPYLNGEVIRLDGAVRMAPK